jgi:hypothetical protein
MISIKQWNSPRQYMSYYCWKVLNNGRLMVQGPRWALDYAMTTKFIWRNNLEMTYLILLLVISWFSRILMLIELHIILEYSCWCWPFIIFFCCLQIAGGCWYVLAIQRVASCLQEECKIKNTCNLTSLACSKEMCFHLPWSDKNGLACNLTSFGQQNIPDCLSGNGPFAYGIYKGALPVISSNSLAVKILYPIFWGLMTLR